MGKKGQGIRSVDTSSSDTSALSTEPTLESIASEGGFDSQTDAHEQEARDCVALSCACLNILVGVAVGVLVAGQLSIRAAFLVVVLQMMVQLLAVPIVMGRFIQPEPHHVEHRVKGVQRIATESMQTLWTKAKGSQCFSQSRASRLPWPYDRTEQTSSHAETPATTSSVVPEENRLTESLPPVPPATTQCHQAEMLATFAEEAPMSPGPGVRSPSKFHGSP